MSLNARTLNEEEFFYGHKACAGHGVVALSSVDDELLLSLCAADRCEECRRKA